VDLKLGHGVPGSSGTSRLQALKQSILEAQLGHAMAMGVIDPWILPNWGPAISSCHCWIGFSQSCKELIFWKASLLLEKARFPVDFP